MLRLRLFKIDFEINFGFLAFCMICQYFFNLNQLICFFFSCFVHEMGHLSAFVLLDEKISKIQFVHTGMVITPKNHLKSFRSDIVILLFGAIFNLIFGIFAIYISKDNYLGVFSVLTGLFHLVCLPCLDGGRIVYIILQRIFDENKAFLIYRICVVITVIIISVFNFISGINNIFVYFILAVSLGSIKI